MKESSLGDAELEALAETLRALREKGTYPVAGEKLLEEAKVDANVVDLARRLSNRQVRVSAKQDQYYRGALAFLPEDAALIASSEQLIIHVVEHARTASTNLHTISALKARLPSNLQDGFNASVRDRTRDDANVRLPAGVGMLSGRKHPYLFLLRDVKSAELSNAELKPPVQKPARPPDAPFEVEFAHAFDELDQQSGRRNVVLISDLRRRLAQIPRPDFDKGLNELRRSKQYSLDSADGRQGRLTPEQVEAGIREAGSVLVYVARR
jgi:hypothetical protein